MTEQIETLAEKIYSTYFGHLDDKGFHEEKVAEISDWLSDGEPDISEVVAIGEWKDFDKDVITYANKSNNVTFRVLEDNGGGVHLIVWQDGNFIFGHSGYQHSFRPEDGILADIEAIETGDTTVAWDNNDLSEAEAVNLIQSDTMNVKTIAEGGYGKERNIYPDLMGRAGQHAFGINAE